MKYIDEKFKDEKPEITVEKIINKLKELGIELNEQWNDSKVENCCSCRVSVGDGVPGTNGKGITPAFARASAYGEFMERLQSGLFFYKYQSFENDESVYLHSFAPDKKYVTKEELLADSDWMEPICKAYNLTKETIASACQIFNCSDKIITLPYYSLFEDKYVYLPAMFVEHIYGANGCCAGNTREEAWVHALSEILERHSSMYVLKKGIAVPKIKREDLKDFKTVCKILDKIEEEGIYDVEVLDYSCGKKYPVIGVRIINKKTKGYLVNVGADPVFEIAVERTLTEIFQGRNIKNFTSLHTGKVLSSVSEINVIDNVFNQVETGNGLFTADFFADSNHENDIELFMDNTNKTNKQLLIYILDKYKKMGLNIYVRNNSFLGFQCYKFVVPGFSDIKIDRIKAPILDYYFANRASKTLRNIKAANRSQLSELLMYRQMIDGLISKRENFAYLSGLPIIKNTRFLSNIHFAYAAYICNNPGFFDKYINLAIYSCDNEKDADYLQIIKQWVNLIQNNIDVAKAKKIIQKFSFADAYKKFSKNLENDNLFDDYLIKCDNKCLECHCRDLCCYQDIRGIISVAGKEYSAFYEGQNRENFIIKD